jgi:hypothetical protein
VATQNNTTVSITPAANIVGTTANSTKTVTLNRGETFAARAETFMQTARLAGSHIEADKPVAVTVCDDLLFVGSSADVTGDQLVPVEGLGSTYVVIRGFAGSSSENVFILATQDNTEVSINGGTPTSLSAGQQMIHPMPTDLTAVIESNYPVYVYQLSGFGASSTRTELGAVLIPSMYSIGSRRIAFNKEASNTHNIFVLVRAGCEDGFTVNGDPTVLQASDFTTVPNMTDWKYARKDITSVATGVVSVSNSKGAFSLGYFYGTSTSATSFGYFSAFGTFEFSAITYMCGPSVTLAGGYARSYEWYFGGVLVGTGPSYEATEVGTYTLEMDQDGTTVTASTTVVRVNAGTIAAQYFCSAPTSSAPLTVVGAVAPDDTEYQWQSSPTGIEGSWTTIPDSISPTYTPTTQTQTRYYRRGMSSRYCDWAYTDAAVVAIVTAGTITTGDQIKCESDTEPFRLLEVSGSYGDTYRWQKSDDGVNWTDIPGPTGATATYQPLPQTSRTLYYRRGTTANSCAMVYTDAVTVSISSCTLPVNPHLMGRFRGN